MAFGLAINGVASLVLLVTALSLTHNASWAAAASAVGSGVAFLVNARNGRRILRSNGGEAGPDIPGEAASTARPGRPRWERAPLLRLGRLCLPLGIWLLFISLNANMPRYFVARYLGTEDLGVFAAVAYLLVAGNTLAAAMGQAATPRLAQYYAAGQVQAFVQLTLRLVGVGAALGGAGFLVTVVAGRQILQLLYGAQYATHVDLLRWVFAIAGVTFVASALNYAMIAAWRFKEAVLLYVAVLAVTGFGCVLLVPRFGLIGAAVATGAGMAVQALASAIVVVAIVRSLVQRSGDAGTPFVTALKGASA